MLALFLLFLAPFEIFCLGVSGLISASHLVTYSPLALEENVDGVRALEDTTEPRASEVDFRVAEPVTERWRPVPLFEEAAETEGAGTLFLPTLGLWFAELWASDAYAGCCVEGCGEVGDSETCDGAFTEGVAEGIGPLFRLLELTLAGGAARLLREMALLVWVVRDLGTLARSSFSPSSESVAATEFNARLAELAVDCVSALPPFKRNPSSDESS